MYYCAASLAWCGTGSAQNGSPPTKEVKPTAPGINMVPDGVVFYRGHTYLIRNERAALVDAILVPEGQVLTPEGRLLPLPKDFSGFMLDRAPDGTVLPTPPKFSGPQVLPGQTGVPQVEQGQAGKK